MTQERPRPKNNLHFLCADATFCSGLWLEMGMTTKTDRAPQARHRCPKSSGPCEKEMEGKKISESVPSPSRATTMCMCEQGDTSVPSSKASSPEEDRGCIEGARWWR